MLIQEPIFVIEHDTKEVTLYPKISEAENDLEAYDIENYTAYDSHFRLLKLYRKDRLNRTGFYIKGEELHEEELRKSIIEDLNLDESLSTTELINHVQKYQR